MQSTFVSHSENCPRWLTTGYLRVRVFDAPSLFLVLVSDYGFVDGTPGVELHALTRDTTKTLSDLNEKFRDIEEDPKEKNIHFCDDGMVVAILEARCTLPFEPARVHMRRGIGQRAREWAIDAFAKSDAFSAWRMLWSFPLPVPGLTLVDADTVAKLLPLGKRHLVGTEFGKNFGTVYLPHLEEARELKSGNWVCCETCKVTWLEKNGGSCPGCADQTNESESGEESGDDSMNLSE